jgi:hypothetical protein
MEVVLIIFNRFRRTSVDNRTIITLFSQQDTIITLCWIPSPLLGDRERMDQGRSERTERKSSSGLLTSIQVLSLKIWHNACQLIMRQCTDLLVTSPLPPQVTVRPADPRVSVHLLFNGAVSNSDNMASNEWMTVNNELERMWKEEVFSYLKVLYRHLPGGTDENRGKHD